MQNFTKSLATLMLIVIGIVMCCALILSSTGCSKDDDVEKGSGKVQEKGSRKVQEVVWDGSELDLYSRSGVTPNHIFHPSSWTTDSYFINVMRQHRIYNHGAIDSISYDRVNINSANAGFIISNYDITIYYKNGFTDILENYLCPTAYGDIFTQYACPMPINRNGLDGIHVTTFDRTLNIENKTLPYRGFQAVKLWEWKIHSIYDGIVTDRGADVLYPETSKSLQWQPKHVI